MANIAANSIGFQARLCPGEYLKARMGLAILALLLLARAVEAGSTNSWTVFRPLNGEAATGPNRVTNPGMETVGTSQPLAGWTAYGSGYTATTNTAQSGAAALQCSAAQEGQTRGASQTIILNQTIPKALKVTGWSKAQAVTGVADSDYSVYLDILYTDGTPLWGQTIDFSVGSHDWEYQEAFIVPALPIQQLTCYLLFRNAHSGTVWFDNISVAEVQETVTQFDGTAVVVTPPVPLPYHPTNRFDLLTSDGLRVQLAQDGGVIEAVTDGTNNLQGASPDYASGWLVCDRGATSAWWNVGGWVTPANGSFRQQGVITGLNLSADLVCTVTNNAIRFHRRGQTVETSPLKA